MKYVLGFLLTLVVGAACAETRNLSAGDIKGLWLSGFPTTQGEVDELEVYADGHIRFLRTFKDAAKQELTSRSLSRFKDLEIIDFYEEGSLRTG